MLTWWSAEPNLAAVFWLLLSVRKNQWPNRNPNQIHNETNLEVLQWRDYTAASWTKFNKSINGTAITFLLIQNYKYNNEMLVKNITLVQIRVTAYKLWMPTLSWPATLRIFPLLVCHLHPQMDVFYFSSYIFINGCWFLFKEKNRK